MCTWEGAGRDGWLAEGRFFHRFEQKSSHCVIIKVHKQSQFTCQVDTVSNNSLTSRVALLVRLIGTAHSIVHAWTVMNL